MTTFLNGYNKRKNEKNTVKMTYKKKDYKLLESRILTLIILSIVKEILLMSSKSSRCNF